VVEPLGRETLIRAGIPGNPQSLNVQVDAAYFPQPGDRLLVSFPSEKLFLFDPDTGKTIYPSLNS
jgi:multiple sugar transport system ATP-binding protein